jgi:hypothetical protein
MLQMLLVASGPTARQHASDKLGGGISRVADHCFCWLLACGGSQNHTGAPSMLQMLLARMGEVRRLTFFLSLDVLQLARAREQHLQH